MASEQVIEQRCCVSVKKLSTVTDDFKSLVFQLYSDINDTSLDITVRDISQQFPSCGYKMMHGHSLFKGIKIHKYRIRELKRRVDPTGIVIQALELKVTKPRVYKVRGPFALSHMDGNH